jgi:hypothetical protein
MTLDFIERQLDLLGIELSVVEKSQLAQPDESAAVARVVSSKPIRYGDAEGSCSSLTRSLATSLDAAL